MNVKLTFVNSGGFYSRRLTHHLSADPIAKNQDYLNFAKMKSKFFDLQADRRSNQAEISRLSAFYMNMSPDSIKSGNHLNSGLYFCSIFSKALPENIIKVAQGYTEAIDVSVLKVMAQKLLNMNQWALAERLINQKFGVELGEERRVVAELVKFEVLGSSGMYKKMVEMLPYLAKLNIPQGIQLALMRILHSKDGETAADESNFYRHFEDMETKMWESTLLSALKCRLLSSRPPSFEVFLSLVQKLSRFVSIDASTLFLAITKCDGLAGAESLERDSVARLRLIFRNMSTAELNALAKRIQGCRKNFPEEIAFALLQEICKNPANIDRNLTSSLLCWIIKYCPEKYPYEVLVHEYYDFVDQSLLNFALDNLGSSDRNAIKFIERCMSEKNLKVSETTLREIVDVALDQFGIEPSRTFLALLHRKGYQLSSPFYLKYVERLLKDESSMRIDSLYECFRRIRAENLHGEVLQKYLSIGEELVEGCLRESDLDKSFSIFNSISKYNLLKKLERSSSFAEFISERCRRNTFTRPFKSTVNLECIRAALYCAQGEKEYQRLLDAKFCAVAMQSAMSQLDFELASEFKAFMSNMGFLGVDLSSCQAILRHWRNKIK